MDMLLSLSLAQWKDSFPEPSSSVCTKHVSRDCSACSLPAVSFTCLYNLHLLRSSNPNWACCSGPRLTVSSSAVFRLWCLAELEIMSEPRPCTCVASTSAASHIPAKTELCQRIQRTREPVQWWSTCLPCTRSLRTRMTGWVGGWVSEWMNGLSLTLGAISIPKRLCTALMLLLTHLQLMVTQDPPLPNWYLHGCVFHPHAHHLVFPSPNVMSCSQSPLP